MDSLLVFLGISSSSVPSFRKSSSSFRIFDFRDILAFPGRDLVFVAGRVVSIASFEVVSLLFGAFDEDATATGEVSDCRSPACLGEEVFLAEGAARV